MKKLCNFCYKFIDRKASVCPYCHKAQKEKKLDKNDQHSDNCNHEHNHEKCADEVITSKNVISEETVARNPLDRIIWVPKHKREGYAERQAFLKGTNRREKGLHIDVSDVSYFQNKNTNKYETKTILEGENKYVPEKLKWWEIYKFADRTLARRKIKKVIKKQGSKKPERLNYVVLLCLCIFTGFIGLHNLYAKNYRRGIVELCLSSVAIFLQFLITYIPWLSNVQYSLIAFPALIAIFMWLFDLVAIIFKKFQYNQTRLNFIYGLDIETRAKLGQKYLDVPNTYVYKD